MWRFLNVRIIIVKVPGSLAMVLGGGAVGREDRRCGIAGSVYRTVLEVLPPFGPKVSRRVMIDHRGPQASARLQHAARGSYSPWRSSARTSPVPHRRAHRGDPEAA